MLALEEALRVVALALAQQQQQQQQGRGRGGREGPWDHKRPSTLSSRGSQGV